MKTEADTLLALQNALNQATFGALALHGKELLWINQWLSRLVPVGESSNSHQQHQAIDRLLLQAADQFALPAQGNDNIWLRRERVDGDEATVYFFHDITDLVVVGTEVRRLREDLYDLNPKHPVTQLLSRDAIIQQLETQVSRSRRYHNPLSLLRLSYDYSALENAKQPREMVMKQIAFYLKDQLRWADQTGMLDDNTYLIILPETTFEAALLLLNKFNSDEHRELIRHLHATQHGFSVGLTEWTKGDDSKKMLQRIQQDIDLSMMIWSTP